jgi:small subunit ribosomal protein S19
MAKKEFTYRGKTLEELKAMPDSELMRLLPARQRRNLKRGFNDLQKAFIKKFQKKNNVETHTRDMIVLPWMVAKTVLVHNGKEFVKVLLEPEMIGMYFGELVNTRHKVAHSAPGIGATKSSASVSVR